MQADDPVTTVRALVQRASRRLTDATDTPKLDARVLAGFALKRSPAALIADGSCGVGDNEINAVMDLVLRRAAGEPVAHITGQREFWSLDLTITPATLIPRPDTETLVDVALEVLGAHPQPRVLDLGTGSGAIALAIASERRGATVVATDASADAVAVARANATRLGLSVQVLEGDWFHALMPETARFDLIVSNPPYIDERDPHLVRGDLRYEPRRALVSANGGYADLETIIDGAAAHLAPGATLALEHGYDQRDGVAARLEQAGYRDVATRRDLAGQPRVTFGRRPV